MGDRHFQLQRTMSLTDLISSSAIHDAIERDLTVPADRSKHRFLLQLPRHNFVLPSLTRFDQDFRKFFHSALVDYGLMQELEETRCLNWCTSLPKFLPLQTLGDGNCLMHAASLCMWAIQDRRLALRKSVYQVLIEDQTDMFRKCWQLEQEKRLEEQHGSPVDCSNEQWNQEWKKTIELASTIRSPQTGTFNPLEEIHIFALANILRRPILVLCDDVHRGNYDESLADVSLGGIYLPLLCDSVDCVKSPIVIGYHQGHFTALVTTEDSSTTEENMLQQRYNQNAVPLMKYDDSDMRVHFLLPDEQQSTDRLVREYLNCTKLEYTKSGITRTILVAVVEPQEPEAHHCQMFKNYFGALQEVYLSKLAEKQLSLSGERPQTPPPHESKYHTTETSPYPNNGSKCCSAHRRCKNTVCENYTILSHEYCHECRRSKTQLCTSPGCTFTAGPDYEGLCSRCFARYRTILEQGFCSVIPSAPPSNRCNNGNCQKEAGRHFNGKCHDCYLTFIRNPLNLANITHRNLTVEQNLAESTNQLINLAESSAKPSPAMPRQNSRLFCSNQTCNNRLENSEKLYCEACQASLPESTLDLHVANTQQPKPSNSIYEVCHISGCGLPAVTYHGELCLKHYKESQSRHHNNHANASKDEQKNTKCITLGCIYYGSPDHNYLCSHCYSKALQEQYDMERIRLEQERAQEEWIRQLDASRCEQYQFEGCAVSRKPFYVEAISAPSRSSSAPPSPNPRRKYSNDTVPCTTKGCASFGFKETQGLCEVCFKKKERLLYKQTGGSGRDRFPSSP